jgi:alkylation response protein AidB-like acyl-CoA dehydrogenase
MDFAFDETQRDIQTLAADVFAKATPDRIRQIESSDDGIDRELWRDLADAGLVGLALPAEVGGGGQTILEAAVVLQEMGRHVAPVPLLSHLFAALPVAAFAPRPELLDGILAAKLDDGPVLGAPFADRIVSLDGERLVLLDEPRIEPTRTTHRHLAGFVSGDGEELARGADVAAFVKRHALAAICATAVGVCEEALRITASYISERKQFDKPIAAFQGATMLAADAYIDVEAIRTTTWSAIWRLAEGHSCDDELAIAKFWVAEGGQRVVHACQHLHGGIGVDVDYPIHRYFLWAKYLELTLGGATRQLLDICI